MAEISQPKRQREVVESEEEALLEVEELFQDSKRQKTYNQILSILEEDEEELSQDKNLSDIFTTLEQELKTDSTTSSSSEADQDRQQARTNGSSSECSQSSDNNEVEEEEEEADGKYDTVIRHLLEASDDELGLPSPSNRVVDGGDEIGGGETLPFPVNDGLWEFEDEAANYYAMLQSELFIQ